MLRNGFAWHFKRYESEQEPRERLTYADAERKAKQAQRGLWSDRAPVAPWDYRAMKAGKTRTHSNCSWMLPTSCPLQSGVASWTPSPSLGVVKRGSNWMLQA
ncbi:MAG: thermonuclease family protein [Pseudomonadota bacterium]